MKQYLLYLAGGIANLSFGEATDWRDYVARKLPEHIIAVSPMRGKDFLKSESLIKGPYDHPLASQPGVTCRDRFDITRCDAVLMNLLRAQKVSIGSMIEIGWIDMLRKPLILVMEPGNVHEHIIVNEIAAFKTGNLDIGIEIAVAVLSPTL